LAKKIARKNKDIAHQNKDIISKILSENYRDKSPQGDDSGDLHGGDKDIGEDARHRVHAAARAAGVPVEVRR